jgi:L-asparagine transporter-like permease
MRSLVVRLILFYVVSMTVMLAVTPWNELGESGSGLTGSPFVRVFAAVGVPYAAALMNLVVVTAALSSANTNLYLTTRMLLSLATSGYAPRALGAVGDNGVPLRAVAVASAGMVAAILLAVLAPARAFLALYGTAVAGMLFIWLVILCTYLRFVRALGGGRTRLPIRLPAPTLSAAFGIASIAAIAATTFAVDGLQYTVISFLPFLAVVSIAYARARMRINA